MKMRIRYVKNENMLNEEKIKKINTIFELFYLKNALKELKKEEDSNE